MRKTAVILLGLFLVISEVLAQTPFRPIRRFTPKRRGGDSVISETASELPEAPQELDEESELSVGNRRFGTFRPNSKNDRAQVRRTPEPSPVSLPAAASELPAATAPVRPTNSRSRGSKNFLESIAKGRSTGITQDQINALRSVAVLPAAGTGSDVRRQPTRVSSAPNRSTSRTQTSLSQPSRLPSSRNSSPAASISEEPALPESPQITEAVKSQPGRKQSIFQLRKRTRVTSSPNKPKMMDQIDVAEELILDKTQNEEDITVKLDDEETSPLDKTIKEALADTKSGKGKQMMENEQIKNEGTPQEMIPIDSEAVVGKTPDATLTEASTTEATTTTTVATTEAPKSIKRISSLTRLRSQKPRTRNPAAIRQRTNFRSVTPTESASVTVPEETTTVAPRLSNRRGGRGNSRGGASLATRGGRPGNTRTFTPRVSSRQRQTEQPIETVSATEEQVIPQQTETERRSRKRELPLTRRKLPSLRSRLARTKTSRRLNNRVASQRNTPTRNENIITPNEEKEAVGDETNIVVVEKEIPIAIPSATDTTHDKTESDDNLSSSSILKPSNEDSHAEVKMTIGEQVDTLEGRIPLIDIEEVSSNDAITVLEITESSIRSPSEDTETTEMSIAEISTSSTTTEGTTPEPRVEVTPLVTRKPFRKRPQFVRTTTVATEESQPTRPSRRSKVIPRGQVRGNRLRDRSRPNESKLSPTTESSLPILRPLIVRPTQRNNEKLPESTTTIRTTTSTTTTPKSTTSTSTTTLAPEVPASSFQGIKVAPEGPRPAVNRGGFKSRPHEDSERDIKRARNGEVIVTQIGTVENSPPEEVRKILAGLGSRRRGLARPSGRVSTTTSTVATVDLNLEDYYYDLYYDEI